jgi:hypothetical protein
MKKIYYLSLAALVLGVADANAQKLYQPAKSIKMKADAVTESRPIGGENASFQSKALNIIWEEDFETSGTAGANALFATSNGDYVGDGVDSLYWELTNAGTNPLGPASELTGQFMRWDSYSPNQNEQPNFAATSVNGAIRTPVIDLSSAPNNLVTMEFSTASIYCCHPQEFPWTVAVSTDGGATFGTPIALDFGVERNTYTNTIDSPLNVKIALDNELDVNAANNDQVVIEFRWVGDNMFTYTSGAFQYNTHYFWDIDDIVIYEKPDYELELTNAWTNDIILDFEYSEIPTDMAGEFIAQAAIVNNGFEIPTGVELSIDILDGGGNSVANASGGTLSQNFTTTLDTITFNTGIDLSTLAEGTYTVEYELVMNETDQVTSNDSKQRTLSVTNNTYAAYNADINPRAESAGFFFSSTTGASTQSDFGNLYLFSQPKTLHGVELAVHPGLQNDATTIDEIVNLSVWQFLNGEYVEIAGPYEYTVTNDMISNNAERHLFSFYESENASGPVQMDADELYLVTFTSFGGPGIHFFHWGTPFDDDNSLRFRLPVEDGPNWYSGPMDEPLMALNFDETLNSEDIEAINQSFNVFPNPASTLANVNFTLENESEVTIELRDLSGKLVYSENNQSMNAGNNNIVIETGSLNAGMYICSLITNGTKTSKKLVIK